MIVKIIRNLALSILCFLALLIAFGISMICCMRKMYVLYMLCAYAFALIATAGTKIYVKTDFWGTLTVFAGALIPTWYIGCLTADCFDEKIYFTRLFFINFVLAVWLLKSGLYIQQRAAGIPKIPAVLCFRNKLCH